MSDDTFHVGIELGGTKVVVAASTNGRELAARHKITTEDPESTFVAIRSALREIVGDRRVDGLGIATFGPVDLRPSSATFGQLIDTPKARWSGIDVIRGLAIDPSVPVNLDTDVNAAVLAERRWGAGTADNLTYLTVGTGVGGGIWANGGIVRGANHSEIGHVRVPRHPNDDHISSCPYHENCLEGMASGTALHQRWGRPAEALGSLTSAAVAIEAWYLAHGIASIATVVPISQVVIGGGVSKLPGLHDAVRAAIAEASGGYPPVPFAEGGPEILTPGLGDDSGVLGAIELARM